MTSTNTKVISNKIDGVSHDEVIELLRRVGKGEIIPRLKDSKATWKSVFAGNVVYLVDGWEIEIFNDCDDWDYVDSVIAPDGRTGEYEDWFGTEDSEGHREYLQPDDLLWNEDEKCYNDMVERFIKAR